MWVDVQVLLGFLHALTHTLTPHCAWLYATLKMRVLISLSECGFYICTYMYMYMYIYAFVCTYIMLIYDHCGCICNWVKRPAPPKLKCEIIKAKEKLFPSYRMAALRLKAALSTLLWSERFAVAIVVLVMTVVVVVVALLLLLLLSLMTQTLSAGAASPYTRPHPEQLRARPRVHTAGVYNPQL